MTFRLTMAFVSIFLFFASESFAEQRPWVAAMQEEMQRAKTLELPGMPRPHHITATLLGEEQRHVEASLGALIKEDESRSRVLKVEVRVGDSAFDSGNFLGLAQEPIAIGSVALQDDADALRHSFWLLADRAYRGATETFEAKRAHEQGLKEQARLQDFSSAPLEHFQAPPRPALPSTSYSDLARAVSEVFDAHPGIQRSLVRIRVRERKRLLLTSEGTLLEDGSGLFRVDIVARTQADDGMVLADFFQVASTRSEQLPSLEEMKAKAEELALHLLRLRNAPVVESYSGPVLFEGRASAQLLRFLLAEELSATPPPAPKEGGSQSDERASMRVGARVLPVDFDVIDDPTSVHFVGFPVIGGFVFDDEGVRAERVDVVRGGMLRSLLSSRIPSLFSDVSNGHGRAGLLGHARGRASNLWVRTNSGLSPQALRDRLMAAAKREGLEEAILIVGLDEPSLTDGVTGSAQDFHAVLPRVTEAYRITSKGRLELVRGLVLPSLRSRDLRQVLAAGREVCVHSYMASTSPFRTSRSMGGELPTSIVAPSLLLPDVDVEPTESHRPLPPIVTKP